MPRNLRRHKSYLYVADREKALDFGPQEFLDLQSDPRTASAKFDLVFDVIGGDG